MSSAANLFPIFVKLADRTCLVVGAGAIASAKIAALLESAARVTVIAPRATKDVESLASAGKISWRAREFEPHDLDGIFLVIAATSDAAVNRAVFLAARSRGILCNAVDDPPNCDFYFPAVVRRGDLQIAISTSGQSPALAQQLRRDLESIFDESAGDGVRALGERRSEILSSLPPSEARKQLLIDLAINERAKLLRHGSSAPSGHAQPSDSREENS